MREDPWERGQRRILFNFGQTIGHALEKTRGFRILTHGEAVALGVVVACRVSKLINITQPGFCRRATELWKKLVCQ